MTSERQLFVIPQPKQVEWSEGAFALTADTWILLLPGAGEQEHRAARSLQDEILQATGLRLSIMRTARPARTDNVVVLASDRAGVEAFLGVAMPGREAARTHGEQAYSLDISPERVLLGGDGDLSLHHAIQTLRQIARLERNVWPSLRIVDWPSLPHRGLMLDVSRGKVPTLETLRLLVDQLSLYKINVLQLYTEHTFVFPHHPRIGLGCGSLNADDILELDAHARARRVELMPNLQSFGHCAHILNLPEYEHLAESAARWSLCPQEEATYAFLADLYGDLLPAFTSRTFNVGCDETWDLGTGRSADAVTRMGAGRVYLEHILRLRDLAKVHGCSIQVWGDILLHHPELVSELPEDVTLLDWHYGASDDYPSVRTFSQSGRTFWVCPGTSSWNTLFPRIENANRNIRTLARLGTENGAAGLLNTDWGDHGHYQPIGQCWYGYIYGAEQAWTGGTTSDEGFDARFGPLFYGERGDQVVANMRSLARLNTMPGMTRGNASNSIFALLDEPLVGEMIEHIPPDTLEEIARVCAESERALLGAVSSSREGTSIEEMVYSARMMGYAARKVLASRRIRDDLNAISQGRDEPAPTLCRDIEALRALVDDLVRLGDEFRRVWLRRARHAEIDITLGHLDRLRDRLTTARVWLQERLSLVQSGEMPSYDLSEYAEDAQGYEILGQGFWRQMREAGVPHP